MNTHMQTHDDRREMDIRSAIQIPAPLTRSGTKKIIQCMCGTLLMTARFAISTILMVLGLPLFCFLMLAGWDLGGLFAHLGNLSAHFQGADLLRRTAFSADLKACFVAALILVLLFRLPGFVRELLRDMGDGGKNA